MNKEEKIQNVKRILKEVLDNESLLSSNVMKEDLFMKKLCELTDEFKDKEIMSFGFDLMDMIYNAHRECPRGWVNDLQKYTYSILKGI